MRHCLRYVLFYQPISELRVHEVEQIEIVVDYADDFGNNLAGASRFLVGARYCAFPLVANRAGSGFPKKKKGSSWLARTLES
jgi:hypothetical protein